MRTQVTWHSKYITSLITEAYDVTDYARVKRDIARIIGSFSYSFL